MVTDISNTLTACVLYFVADMVKSRAEIQKEYRKRLKEKNNDEYLAKERLRRKKGYVPNAQLSRKARESRNKKNRDYLKLYRHKKKQAVLNEQNNADLDGSIVNSSGYESAQTSSLPNPTNSDNQNRLLVRMNFSNRANGPRMRVSKELKKTKQNLKTMKENFDKLKRKYRTAMRSMQRMKRNKMTASPQTPRSLAEKQMKHMHLFSNQKDGVRKALVFTNAVCQEIKSSCHKSSIHKKKVLRNLVAGNVIKKYKLLRELGKKTGMCRNKLSKVSSKSVAVSKVRRIRERARHEHKIVQFMERDDNSRNMPGKADCVKSKQGEKNQKRILTDYLSSLYQKFVSEYPGIKLSFSTFCRSRPKHVLLTSFITRDTCLCTKHQNMSLTLKAIKSQNVEVSVNGEKMLNTKAELVEDVKTKISSDDILIGQWKRVPIEVKGQKKMVMKIIDNHMNKAEFITHVTSQIEEFEEHVSRIKHQYSEMKKLKENLPDNHCIIHMDFSENYSCKSVQEIQSAYWNQTSVTLHPVVVYYKLPTEDELLHKSIVAVSDEMGHNASTVLTIIDQLVPEIKSLNPDVNCFHYWTDSPTSQYRNKIIFNTIANHESKYNISAKWNYWEAGHGKGPCDGLGGTCKRMADEAVKTGKISIQDPTDFFAWTQSNHCNMRNVKFIFVSSETCQQKAEELNKLSLRPVAGTMKIHAVVGKGDSTVSVRNTSCYCDICLPGLVTCDTWREESLTIQQKKSRPEPELRIQSELLEKNDTYTIDEYVAAVYLDNWYIGQIRDIDTDDNTVEVSFLEKKKSLFQWPSRSDIIWVDNSSVLCKISPPKPSGKSKRMLVVNPIDIIKIEELFSRL